MQVAVANTDAQTRALRGNGYTNSARETTADSSVFFLFLEEKLSRKDAVNTEAKLQGTSTTKPRSGTKLFSETKKINKPKVKMEQEVKPKEENAPRMRNR